MLLGEAGLAAIYLVLAAGFLYHWTGWPMLVLVLAAIGCYAMTLAPCAGSSSPKSFPTASAARRWPWQSLRYGSLASP